MEPVADDLGSSGGISEQSVDGQSGFFLLFIVKYERKEEHRDEAPVSIAVCAVATLQKGSS